MARQKSWNLGKPHSCECERFRLLKNTMSPVEAEVHQYIKSNDIHYLQCSQYNIEYTMLSIPLSKLFSFLVSFQQTNAKCTSIISMISIIKNADKAPIGRRAMVGKFFLLRPGGDFCCYAAMIQSILKGMKSPYIVPQMD